MTVDQRDGAAAKAARKRLILSGFAVAALAIGVLSYAVLPERPFLVSSLVTVLLMALVVYVLQEYVRRADTARYLAWGQPGYVPRNSLAVIAFGLSVIAASFPAIVCGHVALVQISRTRERGRGFAIAALVLGYAALIATIVWVVPDYV